MRNRTISLLLAGTLASGALAVSGCQTQMQMAEDHAARILIDAEDALSLERLGAYASSTASAAAPASLVQKITSVKTSVVRKNVVQDSSRGLHTAVPSVSASPSQPPSADEVPSPLTAAGLIVETNSSLPHMAGQSVEGELESVVEPESVLSDPPVMDEVRRSDAVQEVSGGWTADSSAAVDSALAQYRRGTDALPILKRGTSGDCVLELQHALAALGYFNVSPTGYFGRATEASVRAFQRDNNLIPDGMVGVGTRAVLAMRTEPQTSSRTPT